jgi:hypothetical protein
MQGGSLFRKQPEIPQSLIAEISYDKPRRTDLAVCFAFFNYTGSSRLIMNYLYVTEKLKVARIPLFTIELVIEGSQPCIKDALHVYGKSYLFQKENLCRVLEKKLPPKYSKILFLDADIIFGDPGWYDTLSDLLDTNEICHCFETAHWLDLTYRKIIKSESSYISSPDKNILLSENNGRKAYHCGFGWAFKRDWYRKAGFIDQAVLGSGDLIFSFGLYGQTYQGTQDLSFYSSSIKNWYTTIDSPKISFLPVSVYHMFHGSLKNRQYGSRNTIFSGVQDIKDMIIKNKYGVFELVDKSLNEKLFEYFNSRIDDSIE